VSSALQYSQGTETRPRSAAAIVAGLLLFFFSYCAPLELASATVYAGLTLAFAGAAFAIVGLSSPAQRIRIAGRVSRLDERSALARAARAAAAIQATTFDDIGVFEERLAISGRSRVKRGAGKASGKRSHAAAARCG
jgi:hypothetical protein